MRELLGRNKPRSEEVSIEVPIEFAENPQRVQGTTIGSETHSALNVASTSLGRERISDVAVGVNEDEEQRIRAERVGQDDDNSIELEFTTIGRQL